MQKIRAIRIHAYGGPEVVRIDEVDRPAPGAGQVAIAVRAAGVNALDWKIREGFVKDHLPLALPIVLGCEVAGEVVAIGAGVEGFGVGDRVLALVGVVGGYADVVVVAAAQVARMPSELSDAQAAAIPVGGLTAWQAVYEAARVTRGQRVLIHAAAGGVGSFATQFAHAEGAHVIATASAPNHDYVRALGADEVIDHRAVRFEDVARDIDVVLDLVGGDTIERSRGVLARGGILVSIVDPAVGTKVSEGRTGMWFSVRADAARLEAIAAQVARGQLRVEVSKMLPLANGKDALEANRAGRTRGKIVLRLSDR
jgi:N-ethylmaleimide reductase